MEECGNIIVHNQTESRIFLRGYNLIKPEHKRSDGLGTIRLLPHQRETLFDINFYLDSIESKVGTTINLITDNNNNINKQVDINNNNIAINCDEKDVYSIRRSLELETISLICLGRETWDLIETPCYLIIINIVALDILKAKIPPKYQRKTSQSSSQRHRSFVGVAGQRRGQRLRPSLNLPSLIRSSSPTISKSSSKDNISSCSSSTTSSVSTDFSSTNLLQPPNQHFNYNNQSKGRKVNHNYQSSSLRNLHLSSTDHQNHQHNQSLTISQLNKFILTNQLQSTNRSRSWSTLTSDCNANPNQNNQLPSIRLPEPDYDGSDRNLTDQPGNQNKYNYSSLGRLDVKSMVDYNQQLSSQSTTTTIMNSRSNSFHDLLSETNKTTNYANYWKMDRSSASRNQSKSSSLLTKLDKLKPWKS